MGCGWYVSFQIPALGGAEATPTLCEVLLAIHRGSICQLALDMRNNYQYTLANQTGNDTIHLVPSTTLQLDKKKIIFVFFIFFNRYGNDTI